MIEAKRRAVVGLLLANSLAAILVLTVIGLLAYTQPAAAQPAAQGHASASLLPAASDSISMTKRVETDSVDDSIVFNGGWVTYTISITNNSASFNATDISVIDALPLDTLDQITCLSPCEPIVEEQEIPEPLGGTLIVTITRQLSWTVSSLAPGASIQLTFKGRVLGQADGTVFKNRAFAPQYNMNGVVGSASTDEIATTVRANIEQSGQASVAVAPTWFSSDLGGTLSQDWGDFNADGYLDLLLGSSVGTSVYRNEGGRLKLFWNNNRRTYGVRWGDFDADGKLDIVAVGDSVDGSAVVSGTNYLYKQGTGEFVDFGNFTSDFQLVRVAVGQFTGNPAADIVASTNTINAQCPVRLFRNDGAGVFTGPGDCLSNAATAALGPIDFDNNGTLDLAVGLFPNSIVILNNDGAGNFTAANSPASVTIDGALPFLPYDFAWGDYDGNGFLDLAAAFPLQKEARIYRNLGGGVFDSPVEVFRTTKFLSPLSVDWGDYNGDGQLDLAVADEAPKIYLNNLGTFDQSDPMQAESLPGQVWSLRAATTDLGGNLNLALTDRDGPSLLFSGFAPHLASSLTAVDTKPASSLAWGDADKNGTMDLLLGAGPSPAQGTQLFYNNAGQYPTKLAISSGLGPQSVAFGDVNGDGRLDVAVGTAVENRLYLAGHNVPDWTSSAPNFPTHQVAFVDANSDGKLDLLAGANGAGVALYLNTGTMLASTPAFVTAEPGNVRAIAVVDYNQDFYLDFAVAFHNQPARVYRNNHNNTFTSIWDTNTNSQTTSLAWADYNHDGFPDLAVGNFEQGTQVYENISGMLPANHQPVWSSPTAYRTTAVAWGDWDFDGYPDLAIGNDNQPTQVFGNFASSQGLPRLFWLWSSTAAFQTTGLAWGDYDGDGDLDLGLSQKGSGGSSGFYKNGNITPSHLNNSFVPTLSLPNNPTYVAIQRPGQTADGYQFSTSEVLGGPAHPTVTVRYSLFDPDGSRQSINLDAPGNTIARTYFEFSLDGGSTWKTATAAVGWTGASTATSRLGQDAAFVWDIVRDQAISDDARFRIRVVPAIPAGPVQRASTTAVSPPFRVRGVTCGWPENPNFSVSPNPLPLGTTGTFVGSISNGAGQVTFKWNFGDGSSEVLGQVAQHVYSTNGTFNVTLTVTGQPCPKNREVIAAKPLIVGTGQAPSKIYFPLVSGPSSAGTLEPEDSGAAGASADLQLGNAVVDLAEQPLAIGTVSVARGLAVPVSVAGAPSPAPRLLAAGSITFTQVTSTDIGINNEPSLSGNGSRIAFWSTADLTGGNPDGNIEVFLLKLDSGGITFTQISNSTGSILGGFNLSPSIDDSGNGVAFFSDRDLTGSNADNNFEIFRYNVATGILAQLTQTEKGYNILPAMSGSGQYIAFVSDRNFVGNNADGNIEIFRAQILPGGGINYTQVTSTTGGVNDEPSINGDGTRIAFISNQNLDPLAPDNSDNNREVFLAVIGQGGQVTFTQISRTTSGSVGGPSIDGAGSRLAFVSSRAPGPLVSNPASVREVFYADVAGNGTFSLTRATTSTVELGNDQPSISADGTRIGFVSPSSGQVRVYDTLAGSELTSTVGASLNPSLSADGTILVFSHNRQLYLTSYPLASVQVTKTTTAVNVFANSLVRYQVKVHNGGPSPASNVVVTDSIGVINPSFVNGGRVVKSITLNPPGAGTCFGNQPSTTLPITCTLGTLAAHATVTVTVDVTPTAYGTLTNLATAGTSTYQRIATNQSAVTTTVQPLPVAAVDLVLSGPPTGTANLPSVFVANVSPITASIPLTYVWQVTNQLTPTLSYTRSIFTDSQTFIWNPGGVQTVIVSVSNAANVVVTATRVITIFNPVPALTNMTPFTATIGSPALTLNLSGSGFVKTSVVRWNGVALTSGFVNSTTMTATVPAANLTTAGFFQVTVFSGGPGGGSSNPLAFTVNNPKPHIDNTVPIIAAKGGLTFTLTVNGSDFVSGASLHWNGLPALPTVVNGPGTVLTATIPFSYLLSTSPVAITVTNAAPTVGPSNAVNFALRNPTLGLSVFPTTIIISQTATLTASINVSDLQAQPRVITLTSSNTNSAVVPLTVTLPAQASSVTVTVQAGSTGANVLLGGQLPALIGGDTASVGLTVNYRKPIIGPATPLTTTAGGVTFTLTLAGSDFVDGAQAYFDGTPLAPTDVINGSSLTATVPANLIDTPGTAVITVTNPSPSAGPSDPLPFVVVSPTITLNPAVVTLSVLDSDEMTVTISAPQAANRTITITKSPGARFNVPSNVTLPALANWVTFTVTSTRSGGAGVLTATLPASLGGRFDTSQVVVNNPSPHITDVQPDPVLVGLPVTLTVTGSGFVSSTLVMWNDVILTHTEIIADDLFTATVPAALIPIFGDYTITVSNTEPVNGQEFDTATVSAENPVPIFTSMSPITRTAGSSGFQLVVTGTQFVSVTSTIYWNGSPLSTDLVNGQLRAFILTSMLTQPNEYTVTIANSSPGGGFASEVLTFTVLTAQPVIQTISPTTRLVGEPAFTLVITGTGFVTSTDPNRISSVRWSGTELGTTTYISSTRLTANVNQNLVAPDAGVYTVTVLNNEPSPLGVDRISNNAFFTITNYVPVLNSISPTSTNAASGPLVLTLNGIHFVRGTVALFNGTQLSTTFVNDTQVTATVGSSLITTSGTFPVTVENPAPGGGESNSVTFTVNSAIPHLTGVSPQIAAVVSPTIQVVVTGTNFVNGAQILWNGTAVLPTTFSTTRLTATVSSALYPVAGFYTVTVRNVPPPAGGVLADNFLTVTVNNPKPILGTPSPTSTVVGTGGLTVTIPSVSSTYLAGAIGYVDGSPRNTVLNGQVISIGLTITDVRTVGTRLLTVENPDPNFGISDPKSFTITALTVSLAPVTPPTIVITLPTASQQLTVSINSTLQVEDADVNLVSSNPAIVSVPASVTLPDHTASTNFNATTHNISGTVTITASLPASLGGDVSSVVTIRVVDVPITGLNALNSSPTSLLNSTAFTATIATGTNVTYKWNFGDGTGETGFTASPNASHTTTAVGVYTATVTATNPVGAFLLDTTRYTITRPVLDLTPLNLTILLPAANRALTASVPLTSVQSANTTITLSSSHPATASVPANVVLLAGQSSVTFTVTGHQTGTVIVTAALPAALGGDTGTSSVTVQDQAITGLAASNDNPTSLGSPTNFSSVIDTGTHVSYVWNFGNGSATTSPSSNPAAAHSNPVGGSYTAIVSATNSIGEIVTATTAYTINNPTPSIMSLVPSSFPDPATTQVVAINGSNFVSGATVEIQLTSGGPITAYVTSFGSSISLSVTIPGSDLTSVNTYNLWVINPEPPAAIAPRKSAPITFSVS